MNNSLSQKNLNDPNYEDIDLKKYINIFNRRKYIFGIVTIFITSLGLLYTFIKKPVYRGYFQIIVEDENVSSLIQRSPIMEKLNNYIFEDNTNNKTQEAILKSPYVLKPVYEFVKEMSSNNKKFDKISYQTWLNTFVKIEFEEGTNILTIKYKNVDKDLINSTLNLIASKYRDFSMKDREKGIKSGINYLKIQQERYQEKSLQSLKELNKFSINNGLVGDLDGIVDFEKSNNDINKSSENKIDQKNKFSDRSTSNLRYASQFELLEKSEARFLELSSRLKPNSKTLTNLKIEIKNLKKSLKRPNEIILKFRELKRIAKRDEEILENIENNLSLLQLEEVKQLNPWQLITDPTIEDQIVSPKRSQIILISFVASLIIAAILSITKEFKEGKIYELEDYKKIIHFEFADFFLKKYPNLNELIIRNLYSNNKSKGEIGLILLSDNFFESDNFSLPEYLITKYKFNIININKINDIEKLDKIILIAESGKIKYSQLKLIMSYLKTFEPSRFFWVYAKDGIN